MGARGGAPTVQSPW